MDRYRSFSEFWPHYLREHSRPATRALHYAGTSLILLVATAAAATGRAQFLLVLPLVGYGFAWAGHFRFERDRPATFTHPVWSFAADFRMFGFWLTGRLAPELEAAAVATTGRTSHD